ncbi:aspartate dehydrogenase [Tropicimonas sp. IMCC6043]|nr:aspartate dehydrogenase [Tropicimonas sp. IMCC6043]RYH05969.1 aspartate dehydrogenase [Tropicimonas sp. IMCC6043]
MSADLKVGIAGLGAIGLPVARWLDAGVPGLRLVAVSSSSIDKARSLTESFTNPPEVVALEELPRHADVVIEALPPDRFRSLAVPALEAGSTLIVVSLTQLLANRDLVDLARQTGGRIIAATGAIAGLDAVRAAAKSELIRAVMRTRKPPASLAGAVFVREANIDLSELTEPLCLYSGTVTEAAQKFPANVNVAVALSLAGWGPDHTDYEVWADPGIDRNTHSILIETDAIKLEISVANVPSSENPATGRITPFSVMAALERLVSPITIGS